MIPRRVRISAGTGIVVRRLTDQSSALLGRNRANARKILDASLAPRRWSHLAAPARKPPASARVTASAWVGQLCRARRAMFPLASCCRYFLFPANASPEASCKNLSLSKIGRTSVSSALRFQLTPQPKPLRYEGGWWTLQVPSLSPPTLPFLLSCLATRRDSPWLCDKLAIPISLCRKQCL